MSFARKKSGPLLPDNLPDSLNQEEAALLLRLSIRTLREYSQNGTIPHRRVGSRYLYSKNRLLRWLEADEERRTLNNGKDFS